MLSCSDDGSHMTDESSARTHRDRRPVRRGPIRKNLQSQLQGNPPTVSAVSIVAMAYRQLRQTYSCVISDVSSFSRSLIGAPKLTRNRFVVIGETLDDVRHMTDKSWARSHRGRWTVSRGSLGTIQQTKVQGNFPAISGEANL
ncbi:unnamed protein product [Protopolystoma xenopodis]|uniref:Uncharacterized protein n=1 Tax=Protopolystoma xenopodis TaxID=117903 RepID=A0A448XEI2_9PLAT|nr:unnamed protein product [Protopolystoma xenopodis]